MAKITFKTPKLDSLTRKGIITRAFRRKLGARVLKEVKASIAVGKSPVRGQGRYEKYAVDRVSGQARKSAASAKRLGAEGVAKSERARARRLQNRKSLYPNSVQDKFPNKKKRPVNLELSGDMLKKLKWKPIKAGIKFGLISASKKLKKIFEAHNEGTNTAKNVPRRAIIPSGAGEKFTVSIHRRIRDLFLARIRQVIRRK